MIEIPIRCATFDKSGNPMGPDLTLELDKDATCQTFYELMMETVGAEMKIFCNGIVVPPCSGLVKDVPYGKWYYEM